MSDQTGEGPAWEELQHGKGKESTKNCCRSSVKNESSAKNDSEGYCLEQT